MGVLTRFSLDEVKIKRKFFHKHIGTITVLDWTMIMTMGINKVVLTADKGEGEGEETDIWPKCLPLISIHNP